MAELRARNPDGSPLLTLADVCAVNEVLWWHSENERRAQDAAMRSAESRRPRR